MPDRRLYGEAEVSEAVRQLEQTMATDEKVTPWALFSYLDGATGSDPLGTCRHRWGNSMGDSVQLGKTYVAPTGNGNALFQVCTHCGMVRQVST